MSFDAYALDHTKEMVEALRKKDRVMPIPKVVVDAEGNQIHVPDSMHEGFCQHLNESFARWALVPRQDMLMQFFPQVVGFAALYFTHTRESMGVDEGEKFGFAHALSVFSFWDVCSYQPDAALSAVNSMYTEFENQCDQNHYVFMIPTDKDKPLPDNDEGARLEAARQRMVYHIQYFQAKHLLGDVERRECKHDPTTCAVKGLGYGKVLRYLNCGALSESYEKLRTK